MVSKADWFATSSCQWCCHMRKEHPGDGPCMDMRVIWERVITCNCQSFTRVPITPDEARRRLSL